MRRVLNLQPGPGLNRSRNERRLQQISNSNGRAFGREGSAEFSHLSQNSTRWSVREGSRVELTSISGFVLKIGEQQINVEARLMIRQGDCTRRNFRAFLVALRYISNVA